jgi:hypothetical protein
MDLEKEDFRTGSIRKNILGQIDAYYNGKKFMLDTIKTDCRLQLNVITEEYILFVPFSICTQKIEIKL